MLTRLLDAGADLSGPRAILIGGGPVPEEALEEAIGRGATVVQTYGLTEACSQVTTLAPAEAKRKLGSAGRPLLTTHLRIQDGEILVQGPTVAPGRADADGWLHTGDLGRIDEEGFLYVEDRLDDLIVTGGENVVPAEVENVLLRHPQVADAAVVGREDPEWQQAVTAIVVLADGSETTPDELRRHCAESLAGFKVPKRIELAAALPRTPFRQADAQRPPLACLPPMKTKDIFYDSDADLSLLEGKTVAILGYGSQGHAHALNLKDSGVDVVVGLRPDSSSRAKAEEAGLEVLDVAEAASRGDAVMILLPDEKQAEVWESEIADGIAPGNLLLFAHGFSIHFEQIAPPAGVDVGMVAPKGPGHLVRRQYEEGNGVPCLMAVHQDATGNAHDLVLAYASGIGGGRAAVIETTFKDECETDLFGEQAVLCGGASELVRAGFETLVEAGYDPRLAYFECLHELKLIADLMYEKGIQGMRYSISNTAEYGDMTRGKRVIGEESRAAMKQILGEIQSGEFAREWIAENRAGGENLSRMREEGKSHQVEKVGKRPARHDALGRSGVLSDRSHGAMRRALLFDLDETLMVEEPAAAAAFAAAAITRGKASPARSSAAGDRAPVSMHGSFGRGPDP